MNREFLINLMVLEDNNNDDDITNQVKLLNRAIKENILKKKPQESGFQNEAAFLLSQYRDRNPRYRIGSIDTNSLEFTKIYDTLYNKYVVTNIKPVPITVKSDVRKTKIDLAKRKAQMAGKKYKSQPVGVKDNKKELVKFKKWIKKIKEEEKMEKLKPTKKVPTKKMRTMSSVPKPRSELIRTIAKRLVDKAKARKKGQKSELEKSRNRIDQLKTEIVELKRKKQLLLKKMKDEEKMKTLFNYNTAVNKNYPESMDNLVKINGPLIRPKKLSRRL